MSHSPTSTALFLGLNLNGIHEVSTCVRACAVLVLEDPECGFHTRSFVPPSGGVMSSTEQS